MAKNFVFASAVVYIDDNFENTSRFVEMLSNLLFDSFQHSEIILINDHLNDFDSKKLKSAIKNSNVQSITLINLGYQHGLENAMNAGVDISIGDYVYEFDSVNVDYDQNLIIDVFNKTKEGYDLVSATPLTGGFFVSYLFYKIYKRFNANKTELRTESFRILSRRLINRVKGSNKTIPYRKAIYASCGLKSTNIAFKPINNNKKKKDKDYRMKLAINSLLLFTDFGYKVSTSMVMIMILFTILMGIYTVVVYASGKPIEGWTTTLLFLSFAFFGLFALLAIIIKYAQILLELVQRRTPYEIESIEKLSK